MKILAIIQAKMNSVRLPGKVMMDIGGHLMIDWVITRTNLSSKISQTIIATTENEFDMVLHL